AGIEATQPILDRRVVPQIRVRDFLKLGVLHARRGPADRQHTPDIGVEQAFPQDSLTDHAGGAEEDDVQAAILADGLMILDGVKSQAPSSKLQRTPNFQIPTQLPNQLPSA